MASELRVNTSSNRVGLGTITYTDTGPVISGITTGDNFKTGTTNVHSTGVELVNINTAGATATFGGDLSIPDTIVHTGDTNTKIRFPAADTFTIETGGSSRVNLTDDRFQILNRLLTSGDYNYLSGNSSTHTTLTLKKSSSGADSVDYLQLRDNSNALKFKISGDGILFTSDVLASHEGDTNTKIRFPSDDVISFERGGSEALRITTANAILTNGVTAEPLYPHYTTARKIQAEIKGALDVGQTRHHGSLAVNCTNSNSFIGLVRSDNTQTDGTGIGVIGWSGSDGTDYHQAAAIEVVKGAGAGNDDQPGHMIFKTNSGTTSATERFRITSAGKVGVNVTNPDANFLVDVNGSIRVGSGSAGSHVMWSRSGLTAELVIGVDGYGNAVNNEATIQSGSTRPLVFMTNGSEKLRITSDGLVVMSNLTTTQRNAATAVEGGFIYNTTSNRGEYYDGSDWLVFGGTPPNWQTTAGNLSTIYSKSLTTYSISNLSATGGSVTYAVTSGSLPGGMSLSSAGAFSGNVNYVGSDTTSTFTVTATNGSGTTDRVFNIIVKGPISTTYNYTGSTVTWSRPHANVKLVEFAMWGGAGSQGTCSSNSNHAGAGGKTTGQINTSSRSQLYFQVGEAGESPSSNNSAGGWPNGGEGNDEHGCKGAGGGGSSNIYNESGTGSYSNLLAVAGGGGSVSHGNPNSNGGDGGGSSGGNSNRGGNGGSQNAGGNSPNPPCGNSSNAGSQMQGGNAGTGGGCTNAAAGGGGGYYGGGAGANSNSGNSYGGSGGGSGYYDSSNVSSGTTKTYGESGWGGDKPSGIADRPSSSDNVRGGHGCIIIYY